MVPWILEGCAHLDPTRAALAFLFSNTPPEVHESFDKARGGLKGFEVIEMTTDKDLREGQNHNILMEYLMTTDKDVLLAIQDDNQFQSGRILDDADVAFDKYGDRLGILGGRDGYGYWLQGMVGSHWSNSAGVGRRLAEGELHECLMCNTAPFFYSRHTIETVGLNNDQPIFSFEDYCLRCNQVGKQNLCMGTDFKHMKFGRGRPMLCGGPLVANDLRRLQDKWFPITGNIVHG
jgi:hypothetical protein